MYYTKQIYLECDEKSKQLLVEYEIRYLQQLRDLMEYMKYNGKKRFKECCFGGWIYSANCKYLHILATKYILSIANKGTFHYGRSASFVKNSFVLECGKLMIKFGGQCPYSHITLYFQESIEEELKHCDIIRVDLLHREDSWYANLICQK